MSKKQGGKAAKGSRSPDGRASRNPKSTAGSVWIPQPMSKRANLSSAQADRAVDRYLSKHAG